MSPVRIAGDDGRGGKGVDKAALNRSLQLLGAVLILGDRPARTAGAVVLTGAVKEKLSTPGRGPIVRSRGSSGGSFIPHAASLPGDPPAPDLGELRGGIAWQHQGKLTRVGSNLVQAPALEFGVVQNGLQARPFMRPALLGARLEMTRAAVVAFKKNDRKRLRRGK